MEKQATLVTGSLFDERYEIFELVGSGGMGEVYRARHVQMDKIVAIKILRADLMREARTLQRFKHEAHIATGLKHKNIAQVQAFGVANDRPYIVMEFLVGKSLDSVLESAGALKFDRFCQVFAQVCDALAHAHDSGIIHRDLKPANIFFDQFGTANERVVLVDFGIAKILCDETAEHSTAQKMTKTGTTIGTPEYMSPEQCRAESLTTRSDIYSLGCVMYHAAYGSSPFHADSPYQVMMGHGYGSVPLDTVPDGYPKEVIAVFKNALARDPADRYATVSELKQDLDALQRGDQLSRRADSMPANKPKMHPAVRTVVSAAVVVVVSLVAVMACACLLPPTQLVAILHSGHDYNLFKQRVLFDARYNPGRAIEETFVALPDLSISHNVDAAETLAIACRLRLARHQSVELLTDGATLIIDNLPASAWDNDAARIVPLAAEIWAYRVPLRDRLLAEVYAGRQAAMDENEPAAKALAADVCHQMQSRDPDSHINDIVTLGFDLALHFARLDPALCKSLLLTFERTRDPNQKLSSAVYQAQLLDRLHEPAAGLPWWQTASKLAANGQRKDVLVGLRQSVADDEFLSGKTDDALADYARIHEQLQPTTAPEHATVRLVRLAEAYSHARQSALMKNCLQDALIAAPSDISTSQQRELVAEAEWAQGVAYFLSDEPLKAAQAFDKCRQDGPNTTTMQSLALWTSLANAFAERQQTQRHGSVVPEDVKEEFADACWAVHRSDPVECAHSLLRLSEQSQVPDSMRVLLKFHAGVLLREENQLDEACKILKPLIGDMSIANRQADLLAKIADCQYKLRQQSAAKKTCQLLLYQELQLAKVDASFNRSRALVSLIKGRCDLLDGNYPDAEQDFRRVIDLSQPDELLALRRNAARGVITAMCCAGSYDRAIAYLPKVSDVMNPANETFHRIFSGH